MIMVQTRRYLHLSRFSYTFHFHIHSVDRIHCF